MFKLEKLSGLEQKLYFLLEAENKRIVDSNTAIKFLGISKMHAYKLLENMSKKGALDRVKSNLYVRIPAHLVHDKGEYIEDPIIVAMNFTEPYFLSHYTALTIHGLAQQYTKQYYVSTTNPIYKINYHGNIIQPVILKKERFFGFQQRDYGEEKLFVSDLERTIIDALVRPEYTGGYEEVLRCFLDLEKADWHKLLIYTEKMKERILINRLGFVFDLLGGNLKVPSFFLDKLQAMLSSTIYYFESKKKGKFNKKWKIIVDPRLEKVLQGV